MMLATTRQYVERLFQDARIVELRHQTCGQWRTGWYDRPDALLRDAAPRRGTGNLFTSLNRPVARPVTNTMRGAAAKDDDVEIITRLFFDFDPVRPADTPSTEKELRTALEARNQLVATLHSIGWPLPLHARSGNGYHAQYRTELPNRPEVREMMRTLYMGLKHDFSNDRVDFDSKVRNPARICTLYGTTKRKGTPASDRPHRKSTVWIPEKWELVNERLIETLANEYAKKGKTERAYAPLPHPTINGSGDYHSLNVVKWFDVHGHYKRPAGETGKHYVTCPWVNEHSSQDDPLKTDTVIWESDGGWPGFHCSHYHCEGRDVRDVMMLWGDADCYCSQAWLG